MRPSKDRKVSIIGAGQVGSTLALRVAGEGLADVALVDVVKGVAEGKALDLSHSFALESGSRKVTGSTDYAIVAGSSVVAITAGLPRRPGMTREELLEKNAGIVREVCLNVKKLAPDAVLIVITNPLDVMCYLAWKASGFPHARVMGMAGVLDCARLSHYLSEELGVHPAGIDVTVIGSHGDSMVPLPDYCSVQGKPVKDLLPQEKIQRAFQRATEAGAVMVSLSGSAYYAPSASAMEMIRAILNDTNKVMPCSVYAKGTYGLGDVYIGLPSRLGSCGVREIVQLRLSEYEMVRLRQSADVVRKNIDLLGL